MRKLMFILNPNASGFKKFDFKDAIENYLKDKKSGMYTMKDVLGIK